MQFLLDGQETDRLSFRRLMPTDFDAWLPFHQDPRSTQYWKGLSKDPKTACQMWFDKVFYRYHHELGGMNALVDKTSKKLIGQCGLLLQSVDHTPELEIGYSILPEYWQMGYATEAARKCKHFAFENDLAPSLISIIHIDNEPSKKVALNNGMREEKRTVYDHNPVAIFRVFKQLNKS